MKKKFFWFVEVFIIFVFEILRILFINKPSTSIFDEVYFPRMASDFLHKGTFFDVHPPLGKYIIAIGEFIFGNNALGWRIMSVICGILLIYVIYKFVSELFKDQEIGLIAACLFAIDGLYIVYSRVGLIDIFLLLFGFASMYFTVKFINTSQKIYAILAGIFLGLSLNVKWIGAGFIVLAIIYTILYLKNFPKYKKQLFIFFIILPFLVYTLLFIPLYGKNIVSEFIKWHIQAWNYHTGLHAEHIYGSEWWSWPLMIRPIWFYYQEQFNKIYGIIALANPFIIWSSTVALIFALVFLIYNNLSKTVKKIFSEKEKFALWFLLLAWIIFYLPWLIISRVLFFYHYLTAYSFAIIILSYCLMKIKEQHLTMFYVIFTVFIFISLLYLPVWTAYPISKNYFDFIIFTYNWI